MFSLPTPNGGHLTVDPANKFCLLSTGCENIPEWLKLQKQNIRFSENTGLVKVFAAQWPYSTNEHMQNPLSHSPISFLPHLYNKSEIDQKNASFAVKESNHNSYYQ